MKENYDSLMYSPGMSVYWKLTHMFKQCSGTNKFFFFFSEMYTPRQLTFSCYSMFVLTVISLCLYMGGCK